MPPIAAYYAAMKARRDEEKRGVVHIPATRQEEAAAFDEVCTTILGIVLILGVVLIFLLALQFLL